MLIKVPITPFPLHHHIFNMYMKTRHQSLIQNDPPLPSLPIRVRETILTPEVDLTLQVLPGQVDEIRSDERMMEMVRRFVSDIMTKAKAEAWDSMRQIQNNNNNFISDKVGIFVPYFRLLVIIYIYIYIFILMHAFIYTFFFYLFIFLNL